MPKKELNKDLYYYKCHNCGQAMSSRSIIYRVICVNCHSDDVDRVTEKWRKE